MKIYEQEVEYESGFTCPCLLYEEYSESQSKPSKLLEDGVEDKYYESLSGYSRLSEEVKVGKNKAKNIVDDFISIFNRWKPYPQNKPKERGWYICSIRYGEEKEQAYVMDLFWDDKRKLWKDNRRLDVYNMYDVFGYNDETGRQDKKMHSDNLCVRNDVIAFKKLPKIYR